MKAQALASSTALPIFSTRSIMDTAAMGIARMQYVSSEKRYMIAAPIALSTAIRQEHAPMAAPWERGGRVGVEEDMNDEETAEERTKEGRGHQERGQLF